VMMHCSCACVVDIVVISQIIVEFGEMFFVTALSSLLTQRNVHVT